ncbi:hypothetical protein D3C71_944040 [compost metagenome]
MFEQRQQRAFASVQRHIVKKVEHTRVGQFAQFRVHKAAAQHGGDARVPRLDGLRNAECRIHGPRERHGQQHHGGLVLGNRFVRELLQQRVHQRGRRSECLGQRVKRGLAARQRFGIAHKLKALVHRVAQHIGQVVQVQRGQVLGLVVQAQGAKGPAQRVAALVVYIHIQRGEAWALGQVVAACNAVRQRAVAALQEGNGGADGGEVAVLLRRKTLHGGALLFGGKRIHLGGHRAQPFGREQAQHQCQCQVFLERRHPPRAQKAREVGGGGVWRIQLRHRGDDGENALGG